MTPEEEEIIRADERARMIYTLQRRFRIIVDVRETYYPRRSDDELLMDESVAGEQAMLDMIGWLAEQVDFDRFEYNREHYDFAAPPNSQVPRTIERNVWKIEWQ